MKSLNVDMTTGSIGKKLFAFSVPLVFSNIFQVFFNITDIAVAGRFAGTAALGAVGSTPFIIFVATWLLVGLGNGINVIAAFFIGLKNERELSETVHTAALMSLAAGIFLGLAGFCFAVPVLQLTHTKADLLYQASVYFKIYMCGMPAVSLFNFGNAVLSASGDTKSPLFYLLVSGIINIILNITFVVVFGMGVAGVALSSVISLYISAFFILQALFRGKAGIVFSVTRLRINPSKLFRIAGVGIPAGLQGAIFAVANVFVQVGVNRFDSITVAGVAASQNVDQLVYDVMGAFYIGCATFIGQNLGAGQGKRIIKAYWWSTFYSFFAGLAMGLLLYAFGRLYMSLFTDNPAVINAGLLRLKVMSLSYCVSAFMDNTIAACRGLGRTMIPSVIVFLGSCIFRIAWIYTVFAWVGTIQSLYLLYVFSWIITAVFEIIYFVFIFRKTVFQYNVKND